MSAFEPQSSCYGNLPNLSFIIRKPQPLGTELKNAADGGTGLMMIQEGKDAMHKKAFYGIQVGALGSVGATAACSFRLMDATCQYNGLFIGDSWFGSVITSVGARTVLPGGKKVHVIAAVKTNHKFYPKADIEELLSKSPAGSRIVLTATIEGVDLVALGYKYNRKKVLCFVTTRGAGSTKDGVPYIQRYSYKKSRQVRQREVARPAVITTFFRHSALIDNHHQARQSLLALEKAWVVSCGFLRLSCTVLGMEVTNAWKAAKCLKPAAYGSMGVKEFAHRLAGAMLKHADTVADDEEGDDDAAAAAAAAAAGARGKGRPRTRRTLLPARVLYYARAPDWFRTLQHVCIYSCCFFFGELADHQPRRACSPSRDDQLAQGPPLHHVQAGSRRPGAQGHREKGRQGQECVQGALALHQMRRMHLLQEPGVLLEAHPAQLRVMALTAHMMSISEFH